MLVAAEESESAMMAMRVNSSTRGRGCGRGAQGRTPGRGQGRFDNGSARNGQRYSSRTSPNSDAPRFKYSSSNGSSATNNVFGGAKSFLANQQMQPSPTNARYQHHQAHDNTFSKGDNSTEAIRTCNYCHKVGHWKQECYKLQRKLAEDGNQQHNAMQAEEINFIAIVHEFQDSDQPDEDSSSKSYWLIDSGSTAHMTSDLSLLTEFEHYDQPTDVRIGDDTLLDAIGKGKLMTKQGITLSVLYVPNLGKKNLFSIRSITKGEKGHHFLFSDTSVDWFRNGELFYQGGLKGNAQYFEFDVCKEPEKALAATTLET